MYSNIIRDILITYASENGLAYPMTIEDNFNAVATWVEAFVENNVKPPKIINGTWWVWSPEEQGYVDSHVKATGDKGDTITDVEVRPHSVDAQGGEVYELVVTLSSGTEVNAGTFTAPRGISVKAVKVIDL